LTTGLSKMKHKDLYKMQKRWDHGIDSDHVAVLLVLRLPHTILRPKKVKHKK
jgi:hypothetical protein